jgi:hypothetical protein
VTEAWDPSGIHAEIASLHDRAVAFGRQLDAARTEGNEAEVRRLRPLIEEACQRRADLAGIAALREAALLTDRQREGWRALGRCRDALHHLLYLHGGDGVGALEVVEATPTRVTLVGTIIWVDTQSADLMEATFTFDRDSRAINRLVVRAGDEGVSAEAPRFGEWSARYLAERIAHRPESDDQWAVVIREPSS